MVQTRSDAEKGAADPTAVMAEKGATAKAEMVRMKAEITYRVTHAQQIGAYSASRERGPRALMAESGEFGHHGAHYF